MPVHHIRFISTPQPSDAHPAPYKAGDDAWVSVGECAYWHQLEIIELIGGAAMIPSLKAGD